MYQKEATVKSKTGLHARPGSMVAEMAYDFESDIKILFNGNEIDAKEVLDVVSADINCGDVVTIQADGSDEEKAVLDLTTLIETMED